MKRNFILMLILLAGIELPAANENAIPLTGGVALIKKDPAFPTQAIIYRSFEDHRPSSNANNGWIEFFSPSGKSTRVEAGELALQVTAQQMNYSTAELYPEEYRNYISKLKELCESGGSASTLLTPIIEQMDKNLHAVQNHNSRNSDANDSTKARTVLDKKHPIIKNLVTQDGNSYSNAVYKSSDYVKVTFSHEDGAGKVSWDKLKKADQLAWGYDIEKLRLDTNSIELCQLFAEKGDAIAQYSLGQFYYNGKIGNKPDFEQGEYWTKKASDQGNIDAKYMLGLMKMAFDMEQSKIIGHTTRKAETIGEGITIMEELSKQNYPKAQYQLGLYKINKAAHYIKGKHLDISKLDMSHPARKGMADGTILLIEASQGGNKDAYNYLKENFPEALDIPINEMSATSGKRETSDNNRAVENDFVEGGDNSKVADNNSIHQGSFSFNDLTPSTKSHLNSYCPGLTSWTREQFVGSGFSNESASGIVESALDIAWINLRGGSADDLKRSGGKEGLFKQCLTEKVRLLGFSL